MSVDVSLDGRPIDSETEETVGEGTPADEAEAQTATYVRVTIAGPGRRTDLALPLAVPLAELLPHIVELATSAADRAEPRQWALCRLGSAPLDADSTLHSAGVVDGEVLMLAPEPHDLGPALIDDVRDATEDVVDAEVPPWRGAAQFRGLFLVLAATSAVLGCVAIGGLLPPPRAVGAGVVLVPGLLAAAVCTERRPGTALPRILGGLACGWAGVLVWFAPWWAVTAESATAAAAHWVTALRIAATTAAVGAAAEGARRILPSTAGAPAATLVVALAGLVLAGTAAARAPSDVAVGLCGVAAVLAIGVLPRLAVAAGGLADLDERVRAEDTTPRSAVRTSVRAADAIVTGGLVGVGMVAGGASIDLAAQIDPWPRLLGGAIALALIARSRLYSAHAHVIVLRAAGLIGVLASGVRLYLDASGGVASAAVLAAGLAVLFGAIGLSAKRYSEVTTARLSRAATTAEWCLVAVLLPLVAATGGLFDWVSELTP